MPLGIQAATAARSARLSVPRAVSVTLGLALGGAAIGATLGTGVLAAVSLALDTGPNGPRFIFDAFNFTATAGALLGFVALPYTAWSLPGVSIGRILAATSVGTIVGATAGFFATELQFTGAILGAVLGFGCGASWLAIRTREIWRSRE